MPGEGDLPVKAFLAAVAATGYDGWLSLEIFNDQFRGGSPRSISVDGHRSLVDLMDAGPPRGARRRAHRAADARPHRGLRCRVRRVRRHPRDRARAGPLLPRHGLPQGRPPRLQGRDPLPAGRHQPRRQHRARGLRPFRLPHPRRRRLRHRPPRRGRRRHRRARHRPRRPALRAARRPGRADHPGDSRRRRRGACTSSTRARRCPRSGRSSSCRRRRRGRSPTPASSSIDHVGPDHGLRRDAVLAAVLHLDLPHREGADGRHHRPLRRRPQPGDRERRRRACA